jgi:hypothetical protein
MVSEHAEAARQRVRNLSLAAVAGQAGCVTILIVFGALFLGLWLDSQFDQRGPCTFGMLIISVPFSLYAMLRISLGAIRRIQPPVNDEIQHDPSDTKEV